MDIELREEPITALGDYASISTAFEVDRVLDVTARPDGGGFALTERRLDVPWVKDYDSFEADHPASWPKRFDLSSWGLIAARVDGRRAGGTVIAFNTPGAILLTDRSDAAAIWDIRVSAGARGKGVGSALFRAAEQWAAARGARELQVETQNVNVPACRFYTRQGCVLAAVNRAAYPEAPDEIQMLFRKELSPLENDPPANPFRAPRRSRGQ